MAERNFTRITDEQKAQMRSMHSEGHSVQEIAKHFKVADATVWYWVDDKKRLRHQMLHRARTKTPGGVDITMNAAVYKHMQQETEFDTAMQMLKEIYNKNTIPAGLRPGDVLRVSADGTLELLTPHNI